MKGDRNKERTEKKQLVKTDIMTLAGCLLKLCKPSQARWEVEGLTEILSSEARNEHLHLRVAWNPLWSESLI